MNLFKSTLELKHFSSIIITRYVCIAWIITKLICYKLWLAERLFPLVPVHPALATIPVNIHTALFILSLLAMALMIFKQDKRLALLIIVTEIISCMLDQNRWQPWEYQFIFMMAAFLFYKDEKNTRRATLLILAGIYFFSGLSKLNSHFIHDIWEHLILRRWLGVASPGTWLSRVGYLLPVFEVLAGLTLLVTRLRTVSILFLVIMHFFILLVLGPSGLNINEVIWPWNIFMPVLLIGLSAMDFSYTTDFFKKPFTWLVILAWWILPWLQPLGYWDKYLSSVLYSGGVEQLFICTPNSNADPKLVQYIDSTFPSIPCTPLISAYKWGMKEINTAPYPEPRVYKTIMKEWKRRYPSTLTRFYLFTPGFSPIIKEVTE